MESFFISETAKYLYLLFHGSSALIDFFVLSTEGHPLPPLYAPCGGGDCVPEAEAQAEAEARRDAAPHALTVCRSICEGRLTGDALASKVLVLHLTVLCVCWRPWRTHMQPRRSLASPSAELAMRACDGHGSA